MPAEMIFDTQLQTFQADVLQQSMEAPVLVDFWADWCAPCKQLLPVLEKVVQEFQGSVLLAKVNADEQKELAAHLGVRSLPTVKLIVHGKVAGEFSGVQTEAQVRKFLQPHVSNPLVERLDQAKAMEQAGDYESALEILQGLNQSDPENMGIQVMIASIKLQQGARDEARQILNAIPNEHRNSSGYKQLLSRLRFAEKADELDSREQLESRLSQNPDDLAALYQLAFHDILGNQLERGIQRLMTMMKADCQFQDGAAKHSLIELFDMLGAADPLVRTYRRQLYALLH